MKKVKYKYLKSTTVNVLSNKLRLPERAALRRSDFTEMNRILSQKMSVCVSGSAQCSHTEGERAARRGRQGESVSKMSFHGF